MSLLFAGLASVAAGIGAGVSIDRAVVALPAWRRVGLEPWAAFTRRADLGNGKVLYPALGVGSPLLSVLAALAVTARGSGDRRPAYLAALLTLTPLVATAKAGPNVFRIRDTDDPKILAEAYEGFRRWHAVRTVLQSAAFGATVRALVAVARG